MHNIDRPMGAAYDPDTASVIITNLRLADDPVTCEARRWTTGARGPEVTDPHTLAGADLTEFATQAIRLGAFAIAATGAEQDRFGVERLVKEVGEKTTRSATEATALTQRAVQEATDTVARAADEARKAIVKADSEHRGHFTKTVKVARAEVTAELNRVLGGENPEVVERLRPILDKFAADLETTTRKQTDELFGKAVKQLDPTDPTSPMAKHAARLAEDQKHLADAFAKGHEAVVAKLEGLAKDVAAQNAAKEARAKLASVSPIKGDDYESDLNPLLEVMATALGDEFTDTRRVAGAISRGFKGDGLLTVDGGKARVVIEMTDSARKGWNDYLEIAERNRDATASLGLVKTPEQNAGQTIRTLGPRRIVMAFDPAVDDVELLRTVLILLRTAALAISGRHGEAEINTAQEALAKALAELAKLDDVKKVASAIKGNAEKIDKQCSGLGTSIQRFLTEAMTALDGVPSIDELDTTHDAALRRGA